MVAVCASEGMMYHAVFDVWTESPAGTCPHSHSGGCPIINSRSPSVVTEIPKHPASAAGRFHRGAYKRLDSTRGSAKDFTAPVAGVATCLELPTNPRPEPLSTSWLSKLMTTGP